MVGDCFDLLVELGLLILEDGDCDDVAGGSTGSAEGFLAFDEDIGDVLGEGYLLSPRREWVGEGQFRGGWHRQR